MFPSAMKGSATFSCLNDIASINHQVMQKETQTQNFYEDFCS